MHKRMVHPEAKKQSFTMPVSALLNLPPRIVNFESSANPPAIATQLSSDSGKSLFKKITLIPCK
jgi:hypothetical protein